MVCPDCDNFKAREKDEASLSIEKNIFSIKSKDGFTLIETLLALAILSMMLVIVLASVRLGVRSWEKGEEVVESASSARFVFLRLSQDIGAAFFGMQERGGVSHNFFVGSGSELGFVTVAGGIMSAMPSGGTKWVHYSVKEKGLTVREKINLAPDLIEDEAGRLMVLAPDVRAVAFEYKGGEGWWNSWDSKQINELPQAVRVTLTFRDRKSPEVITLAVGVASVGI